MKEYPYLSHLGVPPLEQARDPSPEVFPSTFNPNNKSVWAEAVARLNKMVSKQQDWAQCISRYISLCERRNVYPFRSLHESRNDSISSTLNRRRLELARFVDRVGLFDGAMVKKVDTDVIMTDEGFVLVVDALCEVKDPSFENWLNQKPDPGFRYAARGQSWERNLAPGMNVYVRAVPDKGPRSWIIGYKIAVDEFPSLTNNPTPSRAELEKFVKDVLWNPHFKSIRFKTHTQKPV